MATHLEAGGHGTVRALTRARWDLRARQLWHGPGGLRPRTEGGEDLPLEGEHVLAHDRARVGAVAIEHRLEQLRLVVDRVAEAGHAVQHHVPDAQRVREVALERLGQIRVAGPPPR